jgi:hypothetical protein
MRDTQYYKIVYFRDTKQFDSQDGESTHELSQAGKYSHFLSDEEIITFFDKDVQKEIEIWKIEVTIETI